MMNIRNVLLVIGSAIVAGGVVSCGGGGGGDSTAPPAAPPATVVRSASLTFAQEVPAAPVPSTATGRGAVVVNPTTLEITGGFTFSGLTGAPVAAHIHQAAAGAAGGVVIPLDLSPDNSTATIPAGTTLTAALNTALLAGNLYFNVHTASNPDGEIRGQITGTTGVTAGLATLTGAQEAPTPNASTATGRGTIVFDSTTRAILICYVTHTVTNSTVAHIHTGAPGVSGPANVVDLSANPGPNTRTAPVPTTLTAQQVTDFNAGNTYFNVHSSNNSCPPALTCAAGEIRGQIAVQ